MSLAAFVSGNMVGAQTDIVLVSGSSQRHILVLAVACMADSIGGTGIQFYFGSKPAGSSSQISAIFSNGSQGGFILPYSEVGWFKTNAGESLSVSTFNGSANTSLNVVYTMILAPGNNS